MYRLIATIVAIVMLAAVAASCGDGQTTTTAEQKGTEAQTAVLETAVAAVPPYQPTLFPGRDAINKSLRAGEQGPWYVYALDPQGDPIFYVVSDFRPYNKCHSITSPDRLVHHHDHSDYDHFLGQAPALDGIYYSSGGCHTYVVEDVNSGAMIDLSGSQFTIVASLFPLAIETDPLIPEN